VEEGVRVFDTAQAFGRSESILGEVMKRNDISEKVRIITKLMPEKSPEEHSWIVPAVYDSV